MIEYKDDRTSSRIATARTSLELSGEIGKHLKSQINYEPNLAEITPSELSAIIGRSEGEQYLQSIVLLSNKGICWIFILSNI